MAQVEVSTALLSRLLFPVAGAPVEILGVLGAGNDTVTFEIAGAAVPAADKVRCCVIEQTRRGQFESLD